MSPSGTQMYFVFLVVARDTLFQLLLALFHIGKRNLVQGGNEFVPAVAVQFGGGRHGFP